MTLLTLLSGGTATKLRLDIEGAYDVYGRLRCDVEGAYTVQGLLLLAIEGAYSMTETLRLDIEGAYTVKETDPLRLDIEGAYTTQGRLRAVIEGAYSVARRSHIIPGSEPPVEVLDDVDPYWAINGVSAIAKGPLDPGGQDNEGDLIGHYDGSLLLHDVRARRLYDQQWQVRLEETSSDALTAAEDAIRAACLAGGTVSYQSVEADGTVGAMRSWTFAPSPQPSFRIDQEREALFRSEATVTLRVFPS